MSGFRVPKTVLREAAGSYINGVWTGGSRSVLSALASCQPVVMGKDMQALPEGRHQSDFMKAYAADRLNVTADGEGVQPDIIVHQGFGYEIVSFYANQSSVIPHFKYVMVKIFKFTTEADWLSGALKRL